MAGAAIGASVLPHAPAPVRLWASLPELTHLEQERVIFELNTLPLRSCQLLSSLDGLRDGKVFAEMLSAAATAPADRASAAQLAGDTNLTAAARHRAVLVRLAQPELADLVSAPAAAALSLQRGDRVLLAAVGRARRGG